MSPLGSLDTRVASWLARRRAAADRRRRRQLSRPAPNFKRWARYGALGCGLLVVVAVVLVLVTDGGGSGPDRADPGVNRTATVGPPPDANLAAYITQRKDVLARLPATADVPAMVSLSSYEDPARAAKVLDGYRTTRVLYQLPGGSGPQQLDVRDVAADAPAKVSCRCIYAVVVRATADRLRALADLPGVRLVDPARAGTTFLTPSSTGLRPAGPPGG